MLDERVRTVLRRLEDEDVRDDAAGEPIEGRSLAIAPTTGAFLYALCSVRPACEVLEIGGSRGYSTIWLAAAVRLHGGHVTSLEADPAKVAVARENLRDAGLDGWVDLLEGDARELLAALDGPWDVVFLDAWKALYEPVFALVRPKLEPGSVVVADNVISHHETLGAYSAARRSEPGLVTVTIPLDSGLEVSTVLTDWLLSE